MRRDDSTSATGAHPPRERKGRAARHRPKLVTERTAAAKRPKPPQTQASPRHRPKLVTKRTAAAKRPKPPQTQASPKQGMVGGGAPLVSSPVRPQYPNPDSTVGEWRFEVSAALAPKLQIAVLDAVTRFCYPESCSTVGEWRFGVSAALAPFYRGGLERRKLQIAVSAPVTRFCYRGRRSLRDQGGPPPTMPYLDRVMVWGRRPRVITFIFHTLGGKRARVFPKPNPIEKTT